MEQHSKRDIAKTLGLPVRTVTYWTDFGLVTPDISPSQGKGIARIYSNKNIVEFAMIDILNKYLGINMDSIQRIMMTIRQGSFSRYLGEGKGHEKVSFQFFFDNDLGTKKELCYFERFYGVKGPPIRNYNDFEIIDSDNGIFNFKLGTNSVSGKFVLLGRVKQQALRRLGVNDDYITADMEIPF